MVVQAPFGQSALFAEGSIFFPMRESFLEPIGEEDVLSDLDCNVNNFSFPTKSKNARAFMKQKLSMASCYNSRRRSKAKLDISQYAPATKALLDELENASLPANVEAKDLTPNVEGLLKELELALSASEPVSPLRTSAGNAPVEVKEQVAGALKSLVDRDPLQTREEVHIHPAHSGAPTAMHRPSEPKAVPKQSSVIEPGNVAYIRLRYPNAKPVDYDPNSPEQLTLIEGARVHLQPRVDIISEEQRALEGHLSYAVEPPLPKGLMLDEGTGLISGVPQQMQLAASVHNICISIDATSKGGYPLGKLPLTSCPITVQIVNARDKKRKRMARPL